METSKELGLQVLVSKRHQATVLRHGGAEKDLVFFFRIWRLPSSVQHEASGSTRDQEVRIKRCNSSAAIVQHGI